MKYFTITLFIILLSVISCKKVDLSFNFQGTVYSSNNGLGLSNVQVRIYGNDPGNSLLNLVGTTSTNESGYYDTSIDRYKYEKITIIVSKDNHFSLEEIYSLDDLTTGDPNEIDYTLSPKSWTKFILKNTGTTDSGDVLKIQKVSGKTDCDDCCANETKFYYGDIDTIVYCPNDGDSFMKFYWWAEGSNFANGLDSVYNTPFDTTSYTFEY